MSYAALSRALFCASLALVSTGVLSKKSYPVLSCESAMVEQTALGKAPKGSRRVETHVLEVITAKGPKRFVDKPPHDEGDMGGLHWRYCGYNAQAKAHLIEMLDESTYSGDLLFNETGKLLHAGHTVLFSPDENDFWRSNRKMAWMVRTGPSTTPTERPSGRAMPGRLRSWTGSTPLYPRSITLVGQSKAN